jgi:glycosyltransferase involved in cell wall biosynthesis
MRQFLKLPEDKEIVLFFGSLRRNKGLEILIKALSLESSGRLQLLVAGQRPANSEPSIDWYQTMAREQGVDERITWLIRYIDNREIADIFSCVDVVALPYMKSFAAQSSVLSIAAAYNVPVIASEVGDIGPTMKEYDLGVCVEPESPHLLATSLSSISRYKAARSNKSREFARHSNWTNIGHQHWSLYRGQC